MLQFLWKCSTRPKDFLDSNSWIPHILAVLGSAVRLLRSCNPIIKIKKDSSKITYLVKALNVLGFTCVAPVFRPPVLCSLFVPFQRKARLCQPSLTSGSGSRWPLNPQRPAKILPWYFSFKSLNSLLFLGWLILMWSLIVVVMRNCLLLLLNSARLSSDQSEINEVDYLSHEQRAIISVGSLFFVIAQFVVMKGEVDMTGRGRRSFFKELAWENCWLNDFAQFHTWSWLYRYSFKSKKSWFFQKSFPFLFVIPDIAPSNYVILLKPVEKLTISQGLHSIQFFGP